MNESKLKIPVWVTIYFFEGPEVKTQEVLAVDLPALSGGKTYWRESMSDAERGAKLKERIGRVMRSHV